MIKYIGKRVLSAAGVLLVVSMLTFFVMQMTPGDTAYVMLTHTFFGTGDLITQEDLDIATEMYDLDRPLTVQYGEWMLGALKGDLGTSYIYKKPVMDLLKLKLPYTCILGFLAFFLGLLLAVPLGILTAVYRNRFLDQAIRIGSVLASSVPGFWLGLILIMFFSVKLKWLPVSGMNEGLKSIVLPCVTLMLGMMPVMIRVTRSSVLDVMGQDYMLFAKAKGQSLFQALLHHGVRNLLPPVITMASLQMGNILGGSVVIETVFMWPGIGNLLYNSIMAKDTNMLQGCVLTIALGYILSMICADILNAALNPKTYRGGGRMA
ncbi:MAG: ABC transporter permease [Lachnospiraceae bacterium]|nr:ABC transporter permease [Lachnospiraceae bacterium]